MVLITNNLAKEACLFYDEFNISPPATFEQAKGEYLQPRERTDSVIGTLEGRFDSIGRTSTISTKRERVEEQEQADRQSTEIENSLKPYLETAISSSVAIAYPPPAPIAKMSDLDRRLRYLRAERDEVEAQQILREEGRETEQSRPNSRPASIISSSAKSASEDSSSSVDKPASKTAADDRQPQKTPLTSLEEIKLESNIEQTAFEHAEQLKLWSWYVSRHPPDIRPELYQGINYLSSLVCEGSDKPCTGPEMMTKNFYMQDDCTLGQYLESLCSQASQPCSNKQCSRVKLHHFQVLVHGFTRLQIALDQFPCPSPGNEDKIITWSYCKICKEASPTAIIKDETSNISWSKYLEHAFYPPAIRGGFACPHDAYRHQIRYFALRNLAIRIHNETIDVYDVARPSINLQVRQENRVLIKNREYEMINSKTANFFDSVTLRLKTFDTELVKPELIEGLRTNLSQLADSVSSDRSLIENDLDRTYRLSPNTDVLALNSVYRALQDKVVQWDTEFQELEKKYLPSEQDIKRMTVSHLKRLFAGQDIFSGVDRTVSGQPPADVVKSDKAALDPANISETSSLDMSEKSRISADQTKQSTPSLEVPSFTLDGPEDPASTPLAEQAPQFKSPGALETGEREYNSDSTISALPCGSIKPRPLTTYRNIDSSTSGFDSEVQAFVSKLPKRSRPAPLVADLVRRFQNSAQLEKTIESLGYKIPSTSKPRTDVRESDSEQDVRSKPRLKRQKYDGQSSRGRAQAKAGSTYDAGSSYAMNASRIPTLNSKRPSLARHLSMEKQGGSPNLARNKSEDLLVPHRTHDSIASTPRLAPSDAGVSHERGRRLKAEMGKMGKGKAPVRSRNTSADRSRSNTPALMASSRRGTGGTRVSTIARHFDKISKEAERDRQRRLHSARGRRARPVGITRAKIQVFSNTRDAFRDDGTSDSESSKADDEDEPEPERLNARIPQAALTSDTQGDKPSSERLSIKTPGTDQIDSSASSPAFEPSSVTPSEAPTDISFKDRLQITLPPFDTSTPLLSVPPTPLLTGQSDTPTPAYQASESEGTSTTGQERTSILKTLSNLWAYRSGGTTLLEYPL